MIWQLSTHVKAIVCDFQETFVKQTSYALFYVNDQRVVLIYARVIAGFVRQTSKMPENSYFCCYKATEFQLAVVLLKSQLSSEYTDNFTHNFIGLSPDQLAFADLWPRDLCSSLVPNPCILLMWVRVIRRSQSFVDVPSCGNWHTQMQLCVKSARVMSQHCFIPIDSFWYVWQYLWKKDIIYVLSCSICVNESM